MQKVQVTLKKTADLIAAAGVVGTEADETAEGVDCSTARRQYLAVDKAIIHLGHSWRPVELKA